MILHLLMRTAQEGGGAGRTAQEGGGDGCIAVEAGGDGCIAVEAGGDGCIAVEAGGDGCIAVEAGGDGCIAVEAGGDGCFAVEAGGDGCFAVEAGGDGCFAVEAGGDGCFAVEAGGDGCIAVEAGGDGCIAVEAQDRALPAVLTDRPIGVAPSDPRNDPVSAPSPGRWFIRTNLFPLSLKFPAWTEPGLKEIKYFIFQRTEELLYGCIPIKALFLMTDRSTFRGKPLLRNGNMTCDIKLEKEIQ
ncbi:hypothetical protein SKAU_G00230540 [Synaphobranchus kaupii]|uniref:Uncharacterized protein n=1 Tax=Synaphobranchus kaupii TaxID=118154 RepID=A0A9Q1IR60_SYNKA|nr:hypothetical protein SKAU_G00230540 [Synaphobranchus kaupii]